MLKNKNVAAKWVAFVVQITVVMKIHSHSAVLAVTFQCWTGGKDLGIVAQGLFHY